MAAIFYDGPIQNLFNVYEDFLVYKEGVYYHHTGSFIGGQTSVTLGWGYDKKAELDYWL